MYLINRSPTKVVRCKTPYEVRHGKKPTVSLLQAFGCISFALIPSHKHLKLNDKSKKCVFVGYYSETKPYKLFNSITGKAIASRDVNFHENTRWAWETNTQGGPVITIGDSTFNSSEEILTIRNNNSSGEAAQGEAGDSASHSDSKELIGMSTPLVAHTNGSPPTRTKLLFNLYNICTFALHVGNPQEFKKAAKKKEW